jgi:hypothetical protein
MAGDAKRAAHAAMVRRQQGEVGPIRALVFYLDDAISVCSSRAVDYTSAEDLARQLEPDLDHYPMIEAWRECVCLLRLRADGPPEWRA